jgi:ubiquinone/menaquinone biosynthesis C-methylase UbiE
MSLPWLIVLIVLIAALLYWQLVLAEGTYLGRRVVALLYDLTARRYNRIKQYDAQHDADYLGKPLAFSLQGLDQPLVLDVATGTSRLPLTLLSQPNFHGQVFALDNARQMLRAATDYVAAYRDRITWLWHHAVPLPFNAEAFDAVTCLEALEFMPDTSAALAEAIRVLKPGGVLLVSNRIASGARFMPGKVFSRKRFEALLESLGQTEVTTQVWQVDYDLIWSIKPGEETVARSVDLLDVLRCPRCHSRLHRQAAALSCPQCDQRYPIAADGVIELMHW